jgi:hypothetical protein
MRHQRVYELPTGKATVPSQCPVSEPQDDFSTFSISPRPEWAGEIVPGRSSSECSAESRASNNKSGSASQNIPEWGCGSVRVQPGVFCKARHAERSGTGIVRSGKRILVGVQAGNVVELVEVVVETIDVLEPLPLHECNCDGVGNLYLLASSVQRSSAGKIFLC